MMRDSRTLIPGLFSCCLEMIVKEYHDFPVIEFTLASVALNRVKKKA
jgi:hypothetical protein